MSVTSVESNNDQIQAIAFAKKQTLNPDAFIIINNSDKEQILDINIDGTTYIKFQVYCTSDKNFQDLNYKDMGIKKIANGKITMKVHPKSASTFYGICN